MEIRLHFLLSLLLSAQSGGEPSLTVISQSNLFSHSQFGRQIELTSVLPTNESFIINFEEGYFLCPKKLGNPSKKFRLSRICDGYKDCALGSDELSFDLKCAKDCDPPCSPHGLCMRASALDPKGHCRCDDGYGGADCRAVNVNECKYRPCGMMSECIDKLNGYECKCLPGFQGNGFNCASPEGVISSVKNLLNSDDSSQFKDPNIDLVAPLNKPSYLGTPEQSTSLPTQTEASNQHKPLSILLPVSPTDVVDKVKKILGNNGRRKFRPGSVSTLVTPKFDSIPRIPSHNQNPDKIEPLNPRKSIETKNSNVAFPFPNRPFDINHLNIDPQEKSTTAFPSIDVNKNRPFLPVIRPSSPVTKLDLKEEDIFLKELNQIEPQISREDPRLVACRRQFQGCTDVRGSCMKDLRSCSLSVLDVSDGTRGKLWG
ncbi:unnamed protein product [Lepeophtheirus salmonis]|uniref:(salmon louse) hypothetical protein n=2 Tax=Lepeophtheirus salmonis TaxID=72036 RepID=A0A7R8CX08_LEPSM|nr:unnamed protein product [Lepeophtheirus salmonis]CAF2956187.1 unnamed protein product [Lepeophtheirus salmonis]